MPTTDLIQRYGGVDLAPIGNPNTLRLLQSVDYEIPQLEPAPQSQIPSFQEWYEQWGHTYPNVDVARSTYFDTDGAPIAGPVQPERMSKARHLFNVGVATPVYGAVAAGFDAAGEMREGWHRLKQHVAPTSVADVLTARLALWLADESDPRWREENMRRALQFGKMWDQAHVEQGVDRLHALAMTIREAAPQGDPALEESLLWTHLPAAIGSFSTFIAATSVAGAMTGGVGAGLTAAAMAGAHGVSEQRQRLQRYIDEGLVTREQANNAAMVGVVPGLIQVFPVMRAANRLFPGAGRAMHNSIGRWLVEGGKGALEEAFAEGLGVIGQNAIQRYVEDQIGVDDPVGLLDDFVLQSGVGGGAGFVVNFGLAAIGSRVRGRIHPRMTEREVAKVVAERMDQVERQAAAEGRPATPQDYLGVQNTEEVFTLASIEAELAAMGRMTDQQRQNYIIERAERQHVGRAIARERAIERERALSQRMATWEQMLEQAEAREAAEAEEAARLERQRLDEARLTEPLTQPLVSRSELEAMQALVDEITRNQEQIRADATDPAQVRSDERFEWPRRRLRDLAQWWGVPASLKMLELEGNRIRVLGQIRLRELENAQRAEYWRQREQERQAEARRRRQRPQPRPETVAQPEPVAEPAADPVVDPASQAAADVIETPEAVQPEPVTDPAAEAVAAAPETPAVAVEPEAAPVPVPETVPDAQDTDAAAVDTDAGRVEQIQRQFRAIGPGAEAMANNLADMVADGTIRAIDSDLFMAMHLYLGTSDGVLRRISVRSADVKDVSGRERAGRAQAIREEGQPVRFVVELVQRLAERSGITAERADLNSFTMLLHEYFHAAKHIIFDTAQIEGFDQATIEAVGEVGSEQAIAYFMATTANGDRAAAQYMASSVEEMQAQLLIHRALNRMMGAPDTPLPGTEVAASRLGQMLDVILNRFRSMLARLRVWGLENNITTYLDQLLAGRTPEPDWLRPMDTPAMLWGPDSTGTSRRTLPPGFHVPSMGTRVPEDARAITPVDVSTLQEGGRFVPPDATEEHRFSALMEALTERLGEPEQSGMSEARYWYTDNGRSIRLATHPQYYAFEDTGLNLEIREQQGHLKNLEAGFSADAVADWAIRTNDALAPVDVAAAMQRQRQHRLRTALRFAPSPVAKRFVDKLSMDDWREAVRRHGGRPGRRTKLEIARSAIRLRLEIMTPPTANPDDVPAIAEQAAEDIVAQRPLPELPPNIRAYTESLSFGPLKDLAARLGAPDGRSAAALRANIVQHVESMDPNNMFGPELPDIGPQGRDPKPAPNMDFVGKRVSDANARADLAAMPEAEIRRLAEAFNIPRWEARDTQDLIGEIAAFRSQAADLEAPSVDVLESDGGMMNRFRSDVGTAIKHFTDFPINDFFIDMIDRLERSGDAPILKQAARAFRHMASDTYELMGELSEKLDAALRLVRHFRFDPRAENRALAQAVEQLQQPVWVQGQNHGETLFWMAMEDRLPPGVELTAEQRRIIAAGQDLLRQGGMMHEREGTMRFNHRTGEWEAFRLSNRSVAPRMGTPELWDIQMRGGPELEAIIEAIASAPENDTTVEQVRAHFEQVQQDWMRTSGDDAQSAIARINAEFFREYYYFPSVIRHPSTNAVIQLLETNPFSYFERYAVRTAARLAFNRHMGQAEQQRQQLQAISQELMRTQGNDDALASLVRGAHGLPIQAKYFAQPGRWTHRAELTLSHIGIILRAGILSMTWPQNLWEPLGRILALAGGPMKQDFFTAVGNLWLGGAERRAVLIHTLRRGAQVDHWIRNFSFDPTRPIESGARFMSEFSTFLVRTFWREQSYLAAAVAQAKTERMRRGEGTESDIQDVMVSLGLSRIEAERMARGDGDDAHYLMLSRRGGAFTTNDPQLPIEMSRAEHRRILRTMLKFSTYGYMGARWLYNTIRRGYFPAAKAVIQNPTDNAAWRQFMVANAKFAGVNLGLTAAGSLSYFTMALITGGMLGLRTAWEEFEEDTWAFLRDSWMYSMFGGPFATILRISQSPEQARAQGLMSYIWPGAMINELYDLSTGSGRYRDRSFFGTLANAGTDGRLAVFADRFAPWNRMIWAGLAMIGIGRDEFDMQVADRAYWRARLRIAPMGFSGEHADSIIDEIRQQQRLHGEFRMHMRRGYIAMTSGRSPHLHIQEALRVEGKTNADIARHLRQQKRLSGRWGDPTSAEYRALRARIGDKALQMLRRRDAMFEYWAQTYEPPKQKRRK